MRLITVAILTSLLGLSACGDSHADNDLRARTVVEIEFLPHADSEGIEIGNIYSPSYAYSCAGEKHVECCPDGFTLIGFNSNGRYGTAIYLEDE